MQYLFLVWIAVMVLAIVAELLTTEMIALWFIPAALVSLILSVCGVKAFWIQLLVFACVSAAGVFLARHFFTNRREDCRTNIDAIIGEKCIVTEKIDNYAGSGLVKVKGQIWSARSISDEETFAPGEMLVVIAIEGVKLICKKL